MSINSAEGSTLMGVFYTGKSCSSIAFVAKTLPFLADFQASCPHRCCQPHGCCDSGEWLRRTIAATAATYFEVYFLCVSFFTFLCHQSLAEHSTHQNLKPPTTSGSDLIAQCPAMSVEERRTVLKRQ